MIDDYTAGWLKDQGREGVQETFSARAARDGSTRKNTASTGYTTTSSIQGRKKSGMLPFQILTYVAGSTAPNDLVEKHRLSLMINPSDANMGSTQVSNTQYARDGHVNSLWGSEQATITGNGSSAAFINEDGGLAGTQFSKQGVSKTDSIAYANLMAFVGVIRNNGYRHLTQGASPYQGKLSTKVNSKNPKFGDTIDVGEAPETKVPVSGFNPSSMPSKLIGQSRTRVIHVMDTLAISYGGTTYLGTFNSFTLEDDASSPFKFSYSFEFVVSGILGDTMEGHLSTGSNHNSGIHTYIQGAGGFKDVGKFLKLDKVNEYLANVAPIEYISGAGALQSLVDEGIVQVKKDVSAQKLQSQMIGILPTIARIYSKYAKESPQSAAQISQWNPMTITSAEDSTLHAKGSLHYQGLAVDIRINVVDAVTKKKILGAVKAALEGKGYYILIHPLGASTEHLHVEYNPSRQGFQTQDATEEQLAADKAAKEDATAKKIRVDKALAYQAGKE